MGAAEAKTRNTAGAPVLVLSATDAFAPFLVSILSSCHYGDEEAARAKFEALLSCVRRTDAVDVALGSREIDIAMGMFRWRERSAAE